MTGGVLLAASLSGGFAVLAGLVVLARHRFLVVTVRGDSMLPALHDGDVVLARRCRLAELRVGDVVIIRWADPKTPVVGQQAPQWMVKRVVALPGDPVPRSVREAAVGVPAEVAAAVAGAAAAPEVVPEGSLIVFGDNGGYDSRVFGLLNGARPRAVVVRAVVVRGAART